MNAPPAGAVEIVRAIAQRRSGGGRGSSPGQSRILRLEDFAWVDIGFDLWAVIDAQDIELVAGRSWYRWRRKENGPYAYSTVRLPDGRKSTIQMHRVILGAAKGDLIDHRDGDGLNNRRSNIRFCTSAQNSQNRALRKDSSSQRKGVYLDARRNRKPYSAYIYLNGRQKFLGCFATADEAAEAYAVAARENFGQFARVA